MNATFGARNRDPYFVQARTGAPSAFGLLLNLISYKVSDPVSRPLVLYRQLPDPAWRGPTKLITWGHGYAAIEDLQTKQAVWIPGRCVHPYHGKTNENSQVTTSSTLDLGPI
ncbi:uncharacterized protein LOC117676151 isoform X2 [Pantherophis guttatus]|uniref:Uncharacterized protein LOC117676151 isoform X2 n=1 Tax=Pantherophis guttatus TaxID=94885 RepID=A0ABM3Z2R4_PANGU|nr:uncharacterized protein LOC117676151 isoform X2 [Pantherophis guttatus]